MDEELLSHLRQLTSELRQFTSRYGEDLDRLIDRIDTVLDGARARTNRVDQTPTASIPEGFLSQIPKWLIVYDKYSDNRVIWFNQELERLFGQPLDQVLERNIRREDLFDLPRCLFNVNGYDDYMLSNQRSAIGKARRFSFSHGGMEYSADLTFDFFHYELQLSGEHHQLLREPIPITRSSSNNFILAELLENIPMPTAIKDLSGGVEWCNHEFFRLVQRLSPQASCYTRRADLYGKSCLQLFALEAAQGQRLTDFEKMVISERRPLIAYDHLQREEKRLTLRFIFDEPGTHIKHIGVIGMPE